MRFGQAQRYMACLCMSYSLVIITQKNSSAFLVLCPILCLNLPQKSPDRTQTMQKDDILELFVVCSIIILRIYVGFTEMSNSSIIFPEPVLRSLKERVITDAHAVTQEICTLVGVRRAVACVWLHVCLCPCGGCCYARVSHSEQSWHFPSYSRGNAWICS